MEPFSVSIADDNKSAEFKVQEGEISLHHDSGEVKHLTDKEASKMAPESLVDLEDSQLEGFLTEEQSSHILTSSGNENQSSLTMRNHVSIKTSSW